MQGEYSQAMNEGTQDRTVVLVVVFFLGLAFVGGIAILGFLIWSKVEANALLAISNPVGMAGGALAGILALTRTGTAHAEARAREKVLAEVEQLAPLAPPAPADPPAVA